MKKIFYYIMLFFCVCLAPHYASAAAIIAGTVTDSVTGLPISGALVEAFRGNQVRYSTTTIGDGTYSLSGIEPSVYTLIISAPGYQTQSVGVNPRNGQVTIVDIALVPNGGTISGTVTNAITTLPIAGATIEVFQDNTLIGQATTNGSGGYSVPNLAPGNYVVLATAAGFESHVEGANVQVSAITVVDFALATTPGSIAGTITDSVSTNPIVGAVVQVFDGTILVNFADTDGSGNYTFADLAPGSYTVVASAADYQSKAVGAIVVASATTTVDIALNSNPGSITGLVTNAANGAGIAGSVVEVFQNHTFIASALTDENGNYSITGLAAGDYIVVAGATNFGTASTGATVTANNSTVVDFVLSGVFGSISGTVTDATTTDPIAGVTIGIFDGPEFLVSVITDANGNYQVDDLTPGDYTVIATASNYQIQTKTATVNSNTTTVVNFALASNPGSLSGTVTDATTTDPIPNATVAVFQGRTFITFVVTDNNGDYTIPDLAPGNYFVVARAQGYQTKFSAEIVVENTITTANFALNSSPGTVTGIITDACAGNPVSGALVLVLDGQVIVGFDVTDSNGVYTVATLAPGTYTVMAAKRNFVTQSATVDVISNQTTTLNFVLTPMALPPASIAGCLVCDKYLTQTNYVHKISWTASPGLCVTGYYVYRNGKQIAFVSSSEKLKYVDCAYNKKTATYAVRTINFFGQISASLSITLG